MPSPKVTVEDVDAFSDVSNGSTISVGSAASRGSGRPPQDGSQRSKTFQGGRAKNASKSPYASRQSKTTKQQPLKATSRNLWINAMRNGTASLSTENSPLNTWAGSRPTHAKQTKTGTRGRHFSDVVQVSDFKGKGHSRSASMSAGEPQVSGGGPAYKPPEDYYDEIIELKKIINALKEENGRLSTKLHRVEQDNVLKDRKIEDLLNPRKQPEDVRRTLTDRKGDTSAIVNSLKQKLHAMERTVKDKETELRELKRDLKMTNLEEFEIQSEAYYQEIQRLQLVMLEMQQTHTYSEPVRSTGSPRSVGSTGRARGGGSLQRIQDENRQLIAENQSLKKDLLTAIERASNSDTKKPLNVHYADMNRPQLLQRIHELEQPKKSEEKKHKRHASAEDEGDGDKPDSGRRPSIKDVPGRAELKGTPSQKLSQLREVEAALLEERQKLRSTIVQLKQDRSHYRSVADDLRLQLKAQQEDMAKKHGDEPTPQLERKRSFSNSARSSLRRSSTELRRDEPDVQLLEEFQRKRAAKTLQRQWRRHHDDKQNRETVEMDHAAATLQKNWRKYRQGKNQRWNEEEEEEAVTEIQAALRAHRIRRQQLGRAGDHPERISDDDAVVELQSALRAHLARRKHGQESEDELLSDAERRLKRDRERSSWHRKQEDSDDDLELGASASWSRGKESPFAGISSKRHADYREDAVIAPAQQDSSDSDGVIFGGSLSRKRPDRKPEAKQRDPLQKSQIHSVLGASSERSDLIGRMLDKPENRRGSRTQADSLRSMPRFDPVSEDSDEEVVMSSSKAHSKTSPVPFGGAYKSGNLPKKTARSAREIVDSDDDDDDDDDDGVMTGPSRSRRSLDTGAMQRPGPSRSSAGVTPALSDATESRRQSLSEKLGFTKKKASTGSEQTGWNSRRSSSQGSFSRKGSANAAASGPFRGNIEENDDDDDDSDDDIVMSSFRNKKSSSAAREDRKPTLKKQEATERKRDSLMGGLFSSSTPTSSTDKKSSFRRRSILDQSDDDEDDDDDDVVVATSRVKSKTSAAKRNSSASLWSTTEKSSGSLKKKSSSSSTWGGGMNFENARGVSRKSHGDSQLDELF